jgi:phosphoenolpyruvate carboxylase
MWDGEGKEVDAFVVTKLLTQCDGFFRTRRVGDAVRLTLRVPNTRVEKVEARVLLESLESIPRPCDAARLFYGDEGHAEIAASFLEAFERNEPAGGLTERIVRAAWLRQFLG